MKTIERDAHQAAGLGEVEEHPARELPAREQRLLVMLVRGPTSPQYKRQKAEGRRQKSCGNTTILPDR